MDSFRSSKTASQPERNRLMDRWVSPSDPWRARDQGGLAGRTRVPRTDDNRQTNAIEDRAVLVRRGIGAPGLAEVRRLRAARICPTRRSVNRLGSDSPPAAIGESGSFADSSSGSSPTQWQPRICVVRVVSGTNAMPSLAGASIRDGSSSGGQERATWKLAIARPNSDLSGVVARFRRAPLPRLFDDSSGQLRSPVESGPGRQKGRPKRPPPKCARVEPPRYSSLRPR
jgi:hypothetical protein